MRNKQASQVKPSSKPAGNSSRPAGQGGETQQLAQAGQDVLTTKDGMPIADNQNSLRSYSRGPTELVDHVFLDKLTHFDRERIPERVVHARGSAAHGYFELTKSLSKFTTAKVLTELGKRTPVFTRISTVAGPAGSADTVRDVRGFAVKFYTDEGNWDLVGNNIPVFFIQDAMKFPDLVHAVKREPDRGYPSASSAHDSFWDFISLMPESMHMLMWVMSDRTIPRSLAMVEGFGVHTFRLINAKGESTFVKYHWRPALGAQSLVWDEAVKISGADADFHRRDLFESIEQQKFPAWDLAVQLFTEAQAEAFPFDVLDATKLIPEELVPLQVIGRMVLNRNPDNFFAETEQSAFCPSRIVPGMDFSNDPLLQGRVMSYTDTQVHRLGGPNFQQLPINKPRCPIHHFQRDGFGQTDIPKGRVAYEPNSLAPESARASQLIGQANHATRVEVGVRGRSRSPSFADHYSQARLFYSSQTETEQTHIAAALMFELSKVETASIRERIVSHLRVIDDNLASTVAHGLAMDSLPHAAKAAVSPINMPTSDALSIIKKAKPTLNGRCVGVLMADGTDAKALNALVTALQKAGSRVKLIAPKIYGAVLDDGTKKAADAQLAGSPSVLYDAVVLMLAPEAAAELSKHAAAVDFVTDAFSHLKAIGHSKGAALLLAASGVEIDAFFVPSSDTPKFIKLASQRFWEREPKVRPKA
jgi:catalase